MLIAFHKPYGVLSQFTPESGSKWSTLAAFGFPKSVYPIGRLDADSEGLLLLSDETALNQQLLHPSNGHVREYWAQVERIPTHDALLQLERGLLLGSHLTRPCRASLLNPQPDIAQRIPPIRVRKTVPDCWISIELTEGKFHQVRKMTAAIGHPTLRLIRIRIGAFNLHGLPAGQWRELSTHDRALALAQPSPVTRQSSRQNQTNRSQQ